jgi:hypothetical protein
MSLLSSWLRISIAVVTWQGVGPALQAQEAPAATVLAAAPIAECDKIAEKAERTQCWQSHPEFDCIKLADADEKAKCSFERYIVQPAFPKIPDGLKAYVPPTHPAFDEYILRQDGLVPLQGYILFEVQG